MGVKIIHCADVHIGFAGGDKRLASRRRLEVLHTFLRVIDLGISNEVDLILIAGDLFDNHRINEETSNIIAEKFAQFKGRIFIAPGNHDYYGENTFWESVEFPENVTIFKTKGEAYLIEDLGVVVHGRAFTAAYENGSVLKEFKADNERINIAVVHGEIASDSIYGVVSEKEIEASRMDYIALGHIHKRSEILRAGKTAYAYCGCVEGQGFDELGDMGVYMGTIEKGRANMEFVSLCSRRFVEMRVDISSAKNKNDIPEIILRKIKTEYGEDGCNWFYKIILTGESGINFSVSELSVSLKNTLEYVKIKDNVKSPIGDLRAMATENSIRGIFIAKMLERMEGSGDAVNEKALKLGLSALVEEVVFDED